MLSHMGQREEEEQRGGGGGKGKHLVVTQAFFFFLGSSGHSDFSFPFPERRRRRRLTQRASLLDFFLSHFLSHPFHYLSRSKFGPGADMMIMMKMTMTIMMNTAALYSPFMHAT